MKINRKNRSTLLPVLMFAVLFGMGWQASAGQASESMEVPGNLAIDMKRAMEIAQDAGGGPVSEIELEQEDGQWVYEAELKMPNGGEKEVLINAQTGTVIKMESEDEGKEERGEKEDDD